MVSPCIKQFFDVCPCIKQRVKTMTSWVALSACFALGNATWERHTSPLLPRNDSQMAIGQWNNSIYLIGLLNAKTQCNPHMNVCFIQKQQTARLSNATATHSLMRELKQHPSTFLSMGHRTTPNQAASCSSFHKMRRR